MKPLFIAGITPRCGSNYLANLLGKHKEIERCGIVGEDFLLYHLPKLLHFSEGVSSSWSKVWKWNEKITPASQRQDLNDALQQGLYTYLRGNKEYPTAQYFTTHTPYTQNLALFNSFFKQGKLIVLVRSGIDAVESGVIGSFWSYRRGIRQWAASAKRIIAQMENESILVLRYENLVKEPKKELGKAFDYLGLDPNLFDYDEIEHMPVFGSSTTKQNDGNFKWQRSKKSKDFNPLNRGSHWPNFIKYYFERHAGDAMRTLGYDLPKERYTAFPTSARPKLILEKISISPRAN